MVTRLALFDVFHSFLMQLFGLQDTAFVESVLDPIVDRLTEIEELEVSFRRPYEAFTAYPSHFSRMLPVRDAVLCGSGTNWTTTRTTAP